MKITRTHWSLFFGLSIISLFAWWKLSYPQLAFSTLSVDRGKAISIAREFLADELQIDLKPYRSATIFQADEESNRYLQRTLGFEGMLHFLKENDFDLFYWIVRFFKEGKKEAYHVFISSHTGEIIAFRHSLEDTYAIERIERDVARQKVIEFLNKRYDFDPTEYFVQGDLKRNLDNRADYSFSWQKKSVAIPWSNEPDAGFGKMLVSAKISGDQILSFSKSAFWVPERFNREISRMRNLGFNISSLIHIFYLFLLVSSIYFLIVRRNHLAMHTTKNFYLKIALFSFILSLLASLNQLQSILFDYSTNYPLSDHLIRIALNTAQSGLFISLSVLMPSLSGELLHFETMPEKKEGTFLHYIRTSFLSRDMFYLILLGYLCCTILLGLQSLLITIGQEHWGVWKEYPWMIQMTSASIPLLATFTIAFKAGFMEEIMFRLYAISLGKKIFKNLTVVVIISSLMWGFGHSGYAVFPMWFRGVEVTIMGIFLSIVYLRFGIIPVIVAHYLFDVFWGTSDYLFSAVKTLDFVCALIPLLLPLGFAIIAYVINRQTDERLLKWYLNTHQKYNLNILKDYLNNHWDHFGRMDETAIKDEISSHHWDHAVVEEAITELLKEKGRGISGST